MGFIVFHKDTKKFPTFRQHLPQKGIFLFQIFDDFFVKRFFGRYVEEETFQQV